MSNINLVSYETEKKGDASEKSLLVVSLGLILLLGLYGGLYFYRTSLNKSIQGIKENYSIEERKFSESKAKDVVDFEKRLSISASLVKEGINTPEYLTKIEETILPGVFLVSYSYEEAEGISVECSADNYNNVAKQILNFKKSGYFGDIVAGESSYDVEENRINFTVNFQVKKANQ